MNEVAKAVFAGLAARYDALGWFLSLGQDRRWRQEVVEHLVSVADGLSLDVATGPGGVALAVGRRWGATVVGLDLSAEMLQRARGNLARQSAEIALVQGRGEHLPFPDASFDGLSFTYLLRYVDDPAAAIAEMARVVRPGGVVASMEFGVPPSLPWRGLWWLYTRLVLPPAGLLLGGRPWWEVGRFLGPSISRHWRANSLASLVAAFGRAGLGEVGVKRLSLGGGVVMWGTKQADG